MNLHLLLVTRKVKNYTSIKLKCFMIISDFMRNNPQSSCLYSRGLSTVRCLLCDGHDDSWDPETIQEVKQQLTTRSFSYSSVLSISYDTGRQFGLCSAKISHDGLGDYPSNVSSSLRRLRTFFVTVEKSRSCSALKNSKSRAEQGKKTN